MMLLNEWEKSSWAYDYCRLMKKGPDSEIKKLITDSFFAMLYCTKINDDPEVRKYIVNEDDIRDYRKYTFNYSFKKEE